MQKPFEGLLGNSCELRVLEFLLPLGGVEFNISTLAEEMKVSRPTISRVVKKISEWGMLKTRDIGNATYYSLDEQSPLVKGIVHFNNLIIEKMLGDEVLFEIYEELQLRPNTSVSVQEMIPQSTCESQKPSIKWSEKRKEVTTESNAHNTAPLVLGQEKSGGMIWLGVRVETPFEQKATA